MDFGLFTYIHSRFSNLKPAQKFFASLVIGYVTVKTFRTLREVARCTNPDHRDACSMAVEEPKPNLFPNFFKNKQGLWIFHRDWLLPKDAPLEKMKGVVIIAHGAAEHIQRYEHVAQALNKYGFVVFGIDHQGHGMSEGIRGHVAKFDDIVDDFYLYCKGVKQEYPDVPIFVLGHSLGGLIATITATHHPGLFNGGVLLSSPFFGANRGTKPDISIPAVRWVLERISNYFPRLRTVAIDNAGLSKDPSILYRLKRDPLHFTGSLTVRFGAEAIHAAEDMRKKFDQIDYPFYIFGGREDKVVDPQYWDDLYQSAKTPKELKHKNFFEGMLHETLNESEEDQKKSIDAMLDWLLVRCDKLAKK